MEEVQTPIPEVKDSTEDEIDKAIAAASRMEKANLEMKELLDRQEKMISKSIISGRGLVAQKEITPLDRIDIEAENVAKKFFGR